MRSVLGTVGGRVLINLSYLDVSTAIARRRSLTTWVPLASIRKSFFITSDRKQMASVRVRNENSSPKTRNNSNPHEPKGFIGELCIGAPASKARMRASTRGCAANAVRSSAKSFALRACCPGVKVEVIISSGQLIAWLISVARRSDASILQDLKAWIYE